MFVFLASLVGVPIDQVKYFLCFILSFPLALLLRTNLGYVKTSARVRDGYCAAVGILFCVMCFDLGAIFLLLYTFLCYTILYLIRREVVQWYTVAFCYIYVSSFHVYRIVYNYGEYNMDLSFPLMVMMQRLTYVAFSYHDGGRNEEELSQDQKDNSIATRPSLIEYFGYVFSFYSVLTGPTCTYVQHNDMITGRNIEKHLAQEEKLPSNTLVIATKVLKGGIFLSIGMIIGSYDLDEMILHDQSLSFLVRLMYITIFCFSKRCMYYFVWMTIESISNITGLGFGGFDDLGVPKWDLVTNIDVYGYEFGTFSQRFVIFNRLTVKWLQRVFYERFSDRYKYWLTFVMSLLWHGFYPGYFLFYIGVLTGIEASRKTKQISTLPIMKSSKLLRMIYNIVTFIGITIMFDFCQMSFVYLVHDKVYTVWKYYYFTPLIASAMIILCFPSLKRRPKKD